jgi:peptidyl-tRNA hydrolase, PTH1 family
MLPKLLQKNRILVSIFFETRHKAHNFMPCFLPMISFLKNLFVAKPTPGNNPQEVKYLIAGLGNIGPEYANTRHNIGFMVLDHIAGQKELSFSPTRYGDTAQFRYKGRIFILLKPSTYMNLSGKAIDYWMKKENIVDENLLVIVDDVALPLGALRMKSSGGAGGHNGLENINSVLGTQQFARLRFGIGNDFPKGGQVHFVLGKWEKEEMQVLEPKMQECMEMVLSFSTIGIERTMNLFNKKKQDKKSDNS